MWDERREIFDICEMSREKFLTAYIMNEILSQNPAFLEKLTVRLGLTVCEYYLTIRLWARDFYEVIVDEAEGRINYRLIEIESE